MSERRRKRIMFDEAIPISKQDFIRILEQLPDDTKILRAGEMVAEMKWALGIESQSFDSVPEGEILPEFHYQLTKQPNPVRCVCGADYTGSPHSSYCPLRSKP